ncbi:hypothetical protein [Terrimonas pollutisoli]|uniref:hypothetical protein n=1 Tax=Terrimonas pollutisoli TaxID=3034147 RepID=UPI0023EA989B|nr:hypothetical protein [Terrimonas sp. H1YJ31]
MTGGKVNLLMPGLELLAFLIWQMYQAAGQLGAFQIPELLLLATKPTEIYTEVLKMFSLCALCLLCVFPVVIFLPVSVATIWNAPGQSFTFHSARNPFSLHDLKNDKCVLSQTS